MNYLGIFLTFVFAFLICSGMLVLGSILGPKNLTKIKSEPFECGIANPTPVKMRVYVKFYIIAMLFILFDIETIFFYPWAIVFDELKIFGFVEMFIFIILMLSGYIYAIKKGVLEWK